MTNPINVNFNHPEQEVEQWKTILRSKFDVLPEERQAFVKQAIERHDKNKYILNRIAELDADRPQALFSKKLVRIVVLIIGSATFSAAVGQIARVTLGGAFVLPFSILGGIVGAFAAEQSIKYVFLSILLKISTFLARRSLQQLQPSKETLKYEGHQAKADVLEAVESRHDHLPKVPIFIVVFLCAIEASSVFLLSLRFGLLAAIVSALLPLALLLAIAYFYVKTFELPYKNQEIIERYRTRTSSDEPEQRQLFALIPDRHGYEALHFNNFLAWINTHDVNSPIKTDSMLKCKTDEGYFVTRLSGLENEYCAEVEACQQEFLDKQEALDREPCPEDIARLPLPPHQIQDKYRQWHQGKLDRLKTNRDDRVQFIQERLRIAKEQCHSRIAKARQDFTTAQSDRDGDSRIAS
jgi:membrane protein implicated in regulation of membrane protease activity